MGLLSCATVNAEDEERVKKTFRINPRAAVICKITSCEQIERQDGHNQNYLVEHVIASNMFYS